MPLISRFCLFLLIALFPGGFASATEIYIVAGQSNGWRLSSIAGIPGGADSKILYFGMACASRPEKANLTVIEKLHPSTSGSGLAGALRDRAQDDIVFIQYCVCGSSLGDEAGWYPGDDPSAGQLYDEGIYGAFLRYLADVRLQVEAEGIEWNVAGLFWHQGESDITRPSEEHRQNLTHLFERFRMDLGENLRIVTAHIRDLNEGSRGINAAIEAVAAADPAVAVVPLDGLPFESPTDVHVKPAGCIILGERLAEAYAALIERSRDLRYGDIGH